MPDFSTILQSPDVRALVQDNALERAFHDALYPRLLFRGEAMVQNWPQNVGDTLVFTAPGLIKPKLAPLVPGTDPLPSTYAKEQWTAQIQQYADSIDTSMPTSITAIVNLFLRNAHQLGLSAAQTLNRIVRNKLYNAALSGWTVIKTGSTGAGVTAVPVQRLNGFTRARSTNGLTGSVVKYDTVSSTNPLPVIIDNSGTPQAVNVTAYVPDNPGDETGPGTLTVDAAVTFQSRSYVISGDRTSIVRVGGGLKVDTVAASSLLTLSLMRTAAARFRSMNVPEFADGYFHCHLDPTSEAQVFADAEWRQLMTSLPDYFPYRQFAIGQLLGTVFFRNVECPTTTTVSGGATAAYDPQDTFAGELYNTGITSGTPVHRPLFIGQGAIYEYYQDLSGLITEAGITGKVGEPRINNNGIEIATDRVQLIIRAPLNRLQDQVATSWKFIGDWPLRTDGTTGDAARYKRVIAIETTE